MKEGNGIMRPGQEKLVAFIKNVADMNEDQLHEQMETLFDVGGYSPEQLRAQVDLIGVVRAIATAKFPEMDWLP